MMLEHALAYAARGWKVFPCHPKTKQPLVPLDRDPETGANIPNTGWLLKATTDPEQIRAWWTRAPRAMIGAPCGRAMGAFVLDFDAGEDKDTGEVFELAELIANLERELGCKLPPTLSCTTPRGGMHMYFALPEDGPPPGRIGILGKKSRIDLKSEGGYVIVPPSVRADGVPYTWSAEHRSPAPAAPALHDLAYRRGRWADQRAAADPVAPVKLSERAAAAVRDRRRLEGGEGMDSVDDVVRKYALSALDSEVRNVEQAPKGARNDALNNAALKLGQLVAAGALNEAVVRASLTAAADVSGLAKEDGRRSVQATIESGLRKGKTQPRSLDEIRAKAAERERRRSPRAGAAATSRAAPAPPAIQDGEPPSRTGGRVGVTVLAGGQQTRPPAGEVGAERDMRLGFFPLTDIGNAERLLDRYRGKLLYCSPIGWLRWDGKRWNEKDAEHHVKAAEKRTVREIQKEAEAVRASGLKEDGGRDYVYDRKRDGTIVLYSDKIAQWGRLSESKNRVDALARLAQDEFLVGIEQLDADSMKFNVNNGTLTFCRKPGGGVEMVAFGPHDPADLMTKISPVDYDPKAECPTYDRFFSEIQPEARMRRFLHQWGGYSLTGDTSEQKLAFFYGKGGNGKSVLVDIWSYVAGDYGETTPIETFLDQGRPKSGGQASPDLAMLVGKRMLRTSEPEKGSRMAEALIKLMTGGEQIQARHLNRDFFKYYPIFKLTMSGNYRPSISGADDGIWRRLLLVPFAVSIPKEQRDGALREKLRRETSGILNRLLDGLRDWCENGLIEPEEVTKATSDYRSDSDPLGRFLSACVTPDPGSRVQSSVLHSVYEAWCKASGERAWSNRAMTRAMKERGYQTKQNDVMFFVDVRLMRSIADFTTEDADQGVEIIYDGDAAVSF